MKSYKFRVIATKGGSSSTPQSAEIDGKIEGRHILGVYLSIPSDWQGATYSTLFRIFVNGEPFLPSLGVDGSSLKADSWVQIAGTANIALPLKKTLKDVSNSIIIESYTTDPTNDHSADIIIFTDAQELIEKEVEAV